MGKNLQSEAASSRLKVAAIGLGWVTQNRHLPVMKRQENIDLVGVIDRHAGRAAEVAGRLGLQRHAEAADLAGVPWISEIDAVTVGTAPFSHFSLISEALELGKHVLTEKPFTLSRDDSDMLLKRRDAAGRTLAIVHNFQFARSTRRLLSDISRGKLGEISSISAIQLGNPKRRLPEWYEDLPLGLFYDESPHLLYLMRRVAPGPLEFLRANSYPSTLGHKTPARIDAQYAFQRGELSCPATLSCNFESPVSEWYLLVSGEDRLGIVDVFRDVYICLPNDGAHVTSTVLRTSLAATWQHWMQHIPSGWGHLRKTLFYGNDEVFQRFADAALSGHQPMGISAEDARDVQHMQADIVERAHRFGAAR